MSYTEAGRGITAFWAITVLLAPFIITVAIEGVFLPTLTVSEPHWLDDTVFFASPL